MIKLTFFGDIMCKKQMIDAFKIDDIWDFNDLFSEVSNITANSDYVFGNLETPISFDNTNLTSKEFLFNSPFEFAKAVKENGINFVATANNHCLDNGIKGVESTINSLNKLDLKYSGFGDNGYIFELKGTKIGIISYTYGTNGFSNHQILNKSNRFIINLLQEQETSGYLYGMFGEQKSIFGKIYRFCSKMYQKRKPIYERKERSFRRMHILKTKIKKLKKSDCDIIICYLHIGGQYNSSPTKYTKTISNKIIKYGVNIVVGSHEHVVHNGVYSSISKNNLVAYSLGNFNGVAGVYAKPYDKMAEYSIAWNVFLKGKKIFKTTFSVLKTVETENKRIKTVNVFDLIEKEINPEIKQKLQEDIIHIAGVFSNTKQTKILREYKLASINE